MTVHELIRELIDCPMDADVSFVGTIESRSIENVEEGCDLDFDLSVGKVTTGYSRKYVELSA